MYQIQISHTWMVYWSQVGRSFQGYLSRLLSESNLKIERNVDVGTDTSSSSRLLDEYPEIWSVKSVVIKIIPLITIKPNRKTLLIVLCFLIFDPRKNGLDYITPPLFLRKSIASLNVRLNSNSVIRYKFVLVSHVMLSDYKRASS